MESLEKLSPAALLLLRAALGIVFLFHGYPKLFVNTHGAMQAFEHMGLPTYFAVISGVLEFFGGCLLLAGLFTRVAALLLAGEMVVALWRVHHMFSEPMRVGSYEFPMVLAASAFALACLGAGEISIDQVIFGARRGGKTRKGKSKD
jgi:putative oxidoreductase